ncbi:MAG: hypothetical protein FWG03_11220 [Clostridiales bacterium]|nr:hypothetical protein [Clostridiales bacterium]
MGKKERILAIFAGAGIEGLNLEEGMARFGGNPDLYIKVIKSFVDSIGRHLDKLKALTSEGLEDYAIEVHGIKGSCYGISAYKEGDMAKALEISAKAGDYGQTASGNAPFIDAVETLAGKLRGLLDEVENKGGGGPKKSAPDRDVLESMLEASRDFDIDRMQEALQELEKYEYENDGDLVKWLGEQVTSFSYGNIEERLADLL